MSEAVPWFPQLVTEPRIEANVNIHHTATRYCCHTHKYTQAEEREERGNTEEKEEREKNEEKERRGRRKYTGGEMGDREGEKG